MRKIFVTDNKISEGASSTPKNVFISTLVDIVILEFISMLFVFVLPKDMELNFIYTSIALIPLCFVLLKLFRNVLSSKFYTGVVANQIPYVILYDNKMLVINNIGVVEPTIAITHGKEFINENKLVSELVNIGFTVAGNNKTENNLNKEIVFSDVEKIINNGIAGFYNITVYENVSFIKETKQYYYFKGDLLDKNGNSKGEKQFALMKIYTNYEELKVVKSNEEK